MTIMALLFLTIFTCKASEPIQGVSVEGSDKKIETVLKDEGKPQVMSGAVVVAQPASIQPAVQEYAYRGKNGATGDLKADLEVFSLSLEKAFAVTENLQDVLKELKAYVGAAVCRFAWMAQGKAFTLPIPKDYCVAILKRIVDNEWFFTGLTPELLMQVNDLIKSADNLAASYPAQLGMLDEYAKQIISSDGLTNTSQLIVLMNFLIESLSQNGTVEMRQKVIEKIEKYYDKKNISALKESGIGAKKNAWSSLLFSACLKTISVHATTPMGVDEKLTCLEKILLPRLKKFDYLIQLEAVKVLLDDYLKGLTSEIVALNHKTTKLKTTFDYIDVALRLFLNDTDLEAEQKLRVQGLQESLKNLCKTAGIVLGRSIAAPVVKAVQAEVAQKVSVQQVPLNLKVARSVEEDVSNDTAPVAKRSVKPVSLYEV